MKIGFKPQNLVQNLVLEKFSDNGNFLKRIIEIPGKKAKTLEISYKKANFLPTQWYVANYNVIGRDKQSTVVKTLKSTKSFSNENHTVIQRNNKIGIPEEITIDMTSGEVNRTTKPIKNIIRTGI